VEENVSYKTSYTQFLDLLSEKRIEGKVAKRFDQITSSNESFPYAFTVLFPHGIEYEEGEFTNNELSTIGYLKYAETDALFCGDTTQEILSRLMKEDSLGAFAPKSIRLNDIELLKVPHHGADDGLNDIVLKYFNTKTSVISCGLDNLYGHPHKETLEFLANANSEVYRTDLQGSVVVAIQADGRYTVETIKK
jgi:competence protein ComEC